MLTNTQSKSSFSNTIRDLLSVDELDVDGARRGDLRDRLAEAEDRCAETVNAAFDREVEAALDEAHRSLYELYADRIWRAPRRPRPAFVQSSLDRIRAELEQGFRKYLARRRNRAIVRPSHFEVAEWMQDLALGPHPHENPNWGEFVRESIELDQLKQIVINRSLFFLREPDPWIYAVPRLTGIAKAGLIDLLLDEYGWGKLDHMHSSVYAELMEALDLDPSIDHYERAASWRFLATINHQWMLALTPELGMRLLGTIYLTEADSPAAMTNYLAAWSRLGIDDSEILRFYEIHVSADENHRDVALHEIVIPVCEDDPQTTGEVAIGIFDARTLEAEFAAELLTTFT